MQTVWSRAAQTRSCRCSSCIHSARTVARRSTTKPTRRKFKASDVFTACYSAVFATAALVDAKIKDKRRKQWDQAIADAKGDLGTAATQRRPAGLEQSVSTGDVRPLADSTADGQEQLTWCHSAGNLDNLNRLPTLQDQNKSLDAQLKVLNNHLREALTVEDIGSARRRVSAEVNYASPKKSHEYRLAPRDPVTRVHLDRMQSMVSKLVTSLLLNTKTSSPREPSEGSKNSSKEVPLVFDDLLMTEIMANGVASLKLGTTQLPAYSPLCDKISEERGSLNDSIDAIMSAQSSASVNVDAMVAKICYNLLISSAPPSINTYNIMLVSFTQMQQHNLAQAVVDSFFDDSRFRPNSRTISAILDHYAATKDRSGFLTVIRRMRAVNGDMRIRRRPLNTLADPQVQGWATQWRVIHRDGYLHAKAPRNELVFESLILGSLRILGVRRAILYLRAALREGCDITVDLFVKVTEVCLDRLDRVASLTLLSAVVSHWRQRQGPYGFESNVAGRRCLCQLMDFCGIDHSINPGPYQTLPLDTDGSFRENFRPWLRSMHIESVSQEVGQFAHVISTLGAMMTQSAIEKPGQHQVVLRMLNYLGDQPQENPERSLQSLLDARQLALAGSDLQLRYLQRQLIAIVYDALSPHQQTTYDDTINQCARITLSNRVDFILRLRSTPEGSADGGPILRAEHNSQLHLSAGLRNATTKLILLGAHEMGPDNRSWIPPLRADKWLVSLEQSKVLKSAFPS